MQQDVTIVYIQYTSKYTCSTYIEAQNFVFNNNHFFPSSFLFSACPVCGGTDSRPVRLQAAVPRADVHVHSTAHVYPGGRGGGAGPILMRPVRPWGVRYTLVP